jgi:hypothetical protein
MSACYIVHNNEKDGLQEREARIGRIAALICDSVQANTYSRQLLTELGVAIPLNIAVRRQTPGYPSREKAHLNPVSIAFGLDARSAFYSKQASAQDASPWYANVTDETFHYAFGPDKARCVLMLPRDMHGEEALLDLMGLSRHCMDFELYNAKMYYAYWTLFYELGVGNADLDIAETCMRLNDTIASACVMLLPSSLTFEDIVSRVRILLERLPLVCFQRVKLGSARAPRIVKPER